MRTLKTHTYIYIIRAYVIYNCWVVLKKNFYLEILDWVFHKTMNPTITYTHIIYTYTYIHIYVFLGF